MNRRRYAAASLTACARRPRSRVGVSRLEHKPSGVSRRVRGNRARRVTPDADVGGPLLPMFRVLLHRELAALDGVTSRSATARRVSLKIVAISSTIVTRCRDQSPAKSRSPALCSDRGCGSVLPRLALLQRAHVHRRSMICPGCVSIGESYSSSTRPGSVQDRLVHAAQVFRGRLSMTTPPVWFGPASVSPWRSELVASPSVNTEKPLFCCRPARQTSSSPCRGSDTAVTPTIAKHDERFTRRAVRR